ncbi:MAG: sodium-dependent transporter [Lachnospiraceae bacterium]|jgi:NSS family neurotransmitter:Na+ symporter|nr:sodium-dependent transporter [Lachnospiraceae bacterium]
MEKREQLSSRLGFILISAGCAIGLGNVWRFPYITGQYGGGAFVLMYIFFLIIMGVPIMVMELAVGRASQRSAALSFNILEPKGSKWHYFRYFAIAGNFLLMMFYTTIAGWMLAYFYKTATGKFEGLDAKGITNAFGALTSNRDEMIFWMILICVIALVVCAFGLQKGVENVTKFMMSGLFVIMLILVVRAVTLPGAVEGLKFYLTPNFTKLGGKHLGDAVFAAMGQAFFTLSIGIGSIAIFGSFIGKERSLTGEAITITGLDTIVAIVSGLIIFPSTFAFNINPGEGPGLVFVTLPNVFSAMPLGRFFGSLFFLFMTFAALSTVLAVFQNIITYSRELWGWELKKSVLVNGIILIVLSLPCVLGMTDWASFKIGGKQIMDIEDFVVSNNLLPLGSMVYLLFCVSKHGWGWKNFKEEANAGKGVKFPGGGFAKVYLNYLLPLIVLLIFVQGYWALTHAK